MKPHHTLELQNIDYNVVKNNKKIEYINLECAFDIETTSTYYNDEKTGFMYVWMFGLKDNEHIYYGRTWEELTEFLEHVTDYYDLSPSRRLVCYVHNLAYEFQFMRKYFEWDEVFSLSERKPLKATTTKGIEFRCSMMLSGYSLQKTAENLHSHNIKKLVGDLDYSLIRHSRTPLTLDEMGYCNNDIEILLAYINEQIEQYGDIMKIPMTNTGRVRNYVRDKCYKNKKGKKSKDRWIKYRRIMDDLTVDPFTYPQLKRAFQGGFTHANANFTGELLSDVTSIDFTSSYPSVMLCEQFPMSEGIPTEVETLTQFEHYINNFCLLADIEFTNLRPKIFHENYISESKCMRLENPILNNGRVYSADRLVTTVTDIDFKIIKQCYEWDSLGIKNVIRYHRGYLPKPIIESILDLYNDKTTLKGVKGKEVEYVVSKGMLNSIYGMCVTNIVMDDTIYDDFDIWRTAKADTLESVNDYNKSKNRFLYYPWGVWVTAYARRNLWNGIINIGEDYIYSDTDSIKLLNYPKHKKYVEWYDNRLKESLLKMCKHHRIDEKRLHPKNSKGIECWIGVWDYEGTYDKFKTLGAKRYLNSKGKNIELTCAGLSKKNGINYMMKKSKNNIDKVFRMFNDELYIPPEHTGKLTHTYFDETMDMLIKDYTGYSHRVTVESGIHLEKCDFTLSISRQYGTFLNNLMNGYIYRGIDAL